MPVAHATQLRLAVNWTMFDRTIAESASPCLFGSEQHATTGPCRPGRYRWLVGPLVLAIVLAVTPAIGQEALAVRLRDGSLLRGVLDSRTNESSLVVRWQTASTVVRRAIPWHELREVSAADGPRDRAGLIAAARQIPDHRPANAHPTKLVIPATDPTAPQANGWAAVGSPQTEPTRLADLVIDARLANWDQDPATDGLELRLLPVDHQGEGMPVHGTLSVDLSSEYRIDQDSSPHGRGSEVRSLGKWNLRVTATSDPGGTSVRLPWNAIQPAFDPRCAAYGRLHIEFAVAGEGVFVREINRVRVR